MNVAVHLAQGFPQTYLNAKILRELKFFQNGTTPAIRCNRLVSWFAINYENLLYFRYSISHQIEEDHPQFYKNPIFDYTKYDQLFLGLSVNLMNLQLLQWLADLLGARKEMIHTLNKNHDAHWLFHL